MSINLCSVVGSNTGAVDCGEKRRIPQQFVVGGKEFTASEYADADTFQDAMVAAFKLNTGDASKLYPFPPIAKVAPGSEGNTTGSLPFGVTRRLRKGRPTYTYSVEISQEQFTKLLAFDGKTLPVFTWDDVSNMWGYRANAAANTKNTNVFKGERAYITIEGNGFEDGENVETGVATITVSYVSVSDFEKRGSYISLPELSSSDMVGLKDVVLYEPSVNVSNVYKVKMIIPQPKIDGGDRDIYDEYGALIAAETFTAFTGATFSTPLTITSIAVDSTNKALTVTFDSTAYTALASGAKIKLVPPTAAVLDAADVPGIEIGYIILTK